MRGCALKMKESPKIALVLGAGGAKGIAHVGVLKAFEKHGIKFDFIVGCSMGSIVGACYAIGVSTSTMEERALKLSRSDILDVRVPNKFGFVKGDKADKFIRGLMLESTKKNISKLPNGLADPNFSDCKIPFYAFATDFLKNEGVILSRGKLAPAVRASFSIGGVFRPVKIGSRLLLDGGMISRVPVYAARKIGADIVVAIDCVGRTLPIKEEDVTSFSDFISRVFYIMDYGYSKNEANDADILINIENNINPIKFKNVGELIMQGEMCAEKMIPEILEKIKNF